MLPWCVHGECRVQATLLAVRGHVQNTMCNKCCEDLLLLLAFAMYVYMLLSPPVPYGRESFSTFSYALSLVSWFFFQSPLRRYSHIFICFYIHMYSSSWLLARCKRVNLISLIAFYCTRVMSFRTVKCVVNFMQSSKHFFFDILSTSSILFAAVNKYCIFQHVCRVQQLFRNRLRRGL